MPYEQILKIHNESDALKKTITILNKKINDYEKDNNLIRNEKFVILNIIHIFYNSSFRIYQ